MYIFGKEHLATKQNILKDNIGFVSIYDFSRANSSLEARIHAITSVASICYAKPDAVDKVSLYNRLEAESKGLPSSSFEFVPMLIPVEVIEEAILKRDPFGDFERTLPFDMLFTVKFGTRIDVENDKGGWDEYILTNFRAVSRDAEEHSVDLRDFFNTEEKEIQAIKENYTVFRLKVDLPTRSQFVRSRVNLQELSRRFVSGKKLGFDFYIDEKIEELSFTKNMAEKEDHYQGFKIDAKKLIEISQEFYDYLLANGVKAEAARRFIPQAAYTELWAGFNNFQLDNFLELRLESHSQKEIRFLAEAMRDLWQENSIEEKRRVSRVVTQ
mgnify:FL=1